MADKAIMIRSLSEVEPNKEYDRDAVYAASDIFLENTRWWFAYDKVGGQAIIFEYGVAKNFLGVTKC